MAMKRGWEMFASWHRGLPNPPGTRPMNVDVLWKVVRSSNATYVNALKLMWTSMRGWGGGTAAGSSEAAADEHEQEGDKTAKKAAKALRDAQHTAPEAVSWWEAWEEEEEEVCSWARFRYARGLNRDWHSLGTRCWSLEGASGRAKMAPVSNSTSRS